ncbi:MAG: hypothetical protein HYR85_05225 [Planctomycetes bacterium]|nr:hypothetical protein [Planctomycetota bacterium]MBI3846167.1 hypothetical protein [Planctomycetota bacterium]
MKRLVLSFLVAVLVLLAAEIALCPAVHADGPPGDAPCFVVLTVDILDCLHHVGRPHSRPLTGPETVHALLTCFQAALQGYLDCANR